MTTRILAALVALAIVLPALVYGETMAIDILVAIAMGVCLDEWAGMALPDRRWLADFWMMCCGGALYGASLWGGPGVMAVTVAIATMATLALGVLAPAPSLDVAARDVGRMVLGVAWICGLMLFIPWIRRLEHGLGWMFLLLIVPWFGDTGAYFAGRFFGGRVFGARKLAPAVSPKKTWEGFFGGIVAGVLGVFLVRAFGHDGLTSTDCVVLGCVLGVGAVLGDLSESLFKRAYGVKDSGWIMPGHGGMLDRVDSMLFVAPLVYAYATVIKGL